MDRWRLLGSFAYYIGARKHLLSSILLICVAALWVTVFIAAVSLDGRFLALVVGGGGDFELRYVDSTSIGIVLAWDRVSGAKNYIIERSDDDSFQNFITYSVDAWASVFEDTGWPIDDDQRFRSRNRPDSVFFLDPGKTYYYRARAIRGTGESVLLSNTAGPFRVLDPQSPSDIPRGIAGDLWADVVIGKPTFDQNARWKPDSFHAQFAGGVLIDKLTQPNHLFLADSNQNRVLAFDHLGFCKNASNTPCVVDKDCPGVDSCAVQPGTVRPTFALGQPDIQNYGACNGQATFQTYPNRTIASPSTLCFIPQNQLSVDESVTVPNMAIDEKHNVYVPDVFNNRILMYRDPFNPANGKDAAEVFGQGDFSQNKCNRGLPEPTVSSVCFDRIPQVGVDIDRWGNLWVADAGNDRIMRFPRAANGKIAKEADVIFNNIVHSVGVRVAHDGSVYVANATEQMLVFQPPNVNEPNIFPDGGSTATSSSITHPFFSGLGVGGAFVLTDNGFWGQIYREDGFFTFFYDFAAKDVTKKIGSGQPRGVAMSSTEDLFLVDAWDFSSLFRFASEFLASKSLFWFTEGKAAFWGYGAPTIDSLSSIAGITTAGKQLLVTDGWRVLFWNDYDSLVNGKPADGSWGFRAPSFERFFEVPPPGYSTIQTDAQDRIWISSFRDGKVYIFSSPLQSSSTPLKSVDVFSLKYKDKRGAIKPLSTVFSPTPQDLIFFVPIGTGDRMWLTDENMGRVFRVVNIDGKENPSAGPYIDVVLGHSNFQSSQTNGQINAIKKSGYRGLNGDSAVRKYAQDMSCNRGRGLSAFGRDTLCAPNALALDSEGNLYVVDNTDRGSDGGFTRILRFDVSSIPSNPPSTVFDILPSRVHGMNKFQDVTSCAGSQYCSPRAPFFGPNNVLAVGANPYHGPRFPLIFLGRDTDRPQVALGDFISFPSATHIDDDGNLYVGDWNWHRVLVYKKPFLRLPANIGGEFPQQTFPASVDLKVNGLDSPVPIKYEDQFVASWKSADVSYCAAGGNYVPTADGGLWQGKKPQNNGSKNLLARDNAFGYVSLLTLTIECYGQNNDVASDTVKVLVRDPGFSSSKAQINNVRFSNQRVTINGEAAPYKVDIKNKLTTAVGNISYRSFLVQSGKRYNAGRGRIACGSGAGVVPRRGCTFSNSLRASQNGLAVGDAYFLFELQQGSTTLNQMTTQLRLVASSP